MQNQPCYLKPDDPMAVLLKGSVELGVPSSLLGTVLAAFPQEPPVPLAVLRYTFGPLIVHVTQRGAKSGDLGWLSRETIARWRPRVDLERLEIFCGERPDIVSPAEIWLVVYNATHDAPLGHNLTQVYLWAASRAATASGMVNPLPATLSNVYPLPDDAAIFDGHLSHEYREVCREIIRKVVQHSPVGRHPPRRQSAPAPAAAEPN